jgi:hypothetical protein
MWERQVPYLISTVIGRMHKLTEYDHTARLDHMMRWYNKQAMLLEWELEALHRVSKAIEEEPVSVRAKRATMMAARIH